MDDVHQRERDEVVLDSRVLVRLRSDTDFRQFVAVGLVDRGGLHSHVEPDVLAAFKENWCVGENA